MSDLQMSAARAAQSAAFRSTTESQKSSSSVDYDAFLTLLVAQMKNQDPTQPTDSSEYLAQLAAFSTVEQGIKTNERLEALLMQGEVIQAGSLVGKTYTKGDVTGIIKSVTFTENGLNLKLDNGKIVTLTNGATIS
jgi:flagellar basal-body rod modification protein FlgD